MKCPKCDLDMALDSGWKPSQGFDPRMRKYKCPKHGTMYCLTPKPDKTPQGLPLA